MGKDTATVLIDFSGSLEQMFEEPVPDRSKAIARFKELRASNKNHPGLDQTPESTREEFRLWVCQLRHEAENARREAQRGGHQGLRSRFWVTLVISVLSVFGGIFQISELRQAHRQPKPPARETSHEAVNAFRRKREEALKQCLDLVDIENLSDEALFKFRQAISRAKTRLALDECPKAVIQDLTTELVLETPDDFLTETDSECVQNFINPLGYYFEVIGDSSSDE